MKMFSLLECSELIFRRHKTTFSISISRNEDEKQTQAQHDKSRSKMSNATIKTKNEKK
jgi:hypothetical protein